MEDRFQLGHFLGHPLENALFLHTQLVLFPRTMKLTACCCRPIEVFALHLINTTRTNACGFQILVKKANLRFSICFKSRNCTFMKHLVLEKTTLIGGRDKVVGASMKMNSAGSELLLMRGIINDHMSQFPASKHSPKSIKRNYSQCASPSFAKSKSQTKMHHEL